MSEFTYLIHIFRLSRLFCWTIAKTEYSDRRLRRNFSGFFFVQDFGETRNIKEIYTIKNILYLC